MKELYKDVKHHEKIENNFLKKEKLLNRMKKKKRGIVREKKPDKEKPHQQVGKNIP